MLLLGKWRPEDYWILLGSWSSCVGELWVPWGTLSQTQGRGAIEEWQCISSQGRLGGRRTFLVFSHTKGVLATLRSFLSNPHAIHSMTILNELLLLHGGLSRETATYGLLQLALTLPRWHVETHPCEVTYHYNSEHISLSCPLLHPHFSSWAAKPNPFRSHHIRFGGKCV